MEKLDIKRIPGFYMYYISKNGDVYSTHFNKIRKLKPGRDKRGYLQVVLHKDGKPHGKRTHILVLETYVGPRPEGMEACHYDGDSGNSNLDNLRWDTHKNNCKDMMRHGNLALGEQSVNAKLTDEKVNKIRELYATGRYSQNKLANRFGVDHSSIGYVVRRESWKHI